jgi:hypothetical protein
MPFDDEAFNNVNSGEPPVWIEDGVYPALGVGRTVKMSPWGEKLTLTWSICKSPQFRETGAQSPSWKSLSSYYNVKRDKARRLEFGPHSAYLKDWIAANYGRHPEPRYSLPLSVFMDRWLFVRVVTVRKDQRGALHESCYWSKVQCVIRPIGDEETIERLPLQLSDVTWKTP